jgi:hypothetical protein
MLVKQHKISRAERRVIEFHRASLGFGFGFGFGLLGLADYRVTPPIKTPKRQNTAIATHRRRRNARECYATAKQVLRNHA